VKLPDGQIFTGKRHADAYKLAIKSRGINIPVETNKNGKG
jgi:hypothetical protein